MTVNELVNIQWHWEGGQIVFDDGFPGQLEDDEALLIQVMDGRIFVLADTNTSLGICDDCKNREIENLEVRLWKKIKFTETDLA